MAMGMIGDGGVRQGKQTKSERVARDLEVMARQLGAGERLPSVRSLCTSLCISLATLNAAMRSLEARGVIERRHGSGVYVAESIAIKRIAVVVNSGFLLAGGSPVWGMLFGEIMTRMPAGEAEAAIFMATPPKEGGLPQTLPADLVYAIEQGRVDGVIGIGLHVNAVNALELAGLQVVSFSGSGDWVFRVNVVDMAQELARGFLKAGLKTAVIAGCSNAAQWEENRVALEEAGLRVLGESDEQWSEGGLVERMSHPFLHLGQDFATNFESVVQGPERPDVLFLMDDIFAQGFLMIWRNSKYRDSVQLACHSNRELRMYMGWEGQLGLMEIEILPLAQVLVDAALLSLKGKKLNSLGCAQQLKLNDESLAMETKTENGRLITTLKWKAQLLT
ncbi:MAG: GntR family transcriptional regulator [Fimbriimonadaceae bacterium]